MNNQPLSPDLFESAYVPHWHTKIANLKEQALPEPWTFKNAPDERQGRENFVLERYVNAIYTSQVTNLQLSANREEADQHFVVRNGFACFNTGLLTKHYKPIYCYLEKNYDGYTQPWFLMGFLDDSHPRMHKIEHLPQKPFSQLKPEEWTFSPNIPIRINIDHILETPENMLRIPENLRSFPNLHMLLQAAVEMARRTAEYIPSLVVPQVYQERIQHLLPLSLTDPKHIDLVMTIERKDGFYLGSTCLTPQMAYSNARMLARPTAPWLTDLVA